ncbi:hypothetical protein C7U60_18595 [Mesorhizobium plurifarium]|nr:hypothetical protein C7U60_18725 [Mesorhizobium plurifarium]PST18830.1 hypothetical protein C7U60_18595 [Mesorhizobium plurifarium]
MGILHACLGIGFAAIAQRESRNFPARIRLHATDENLHLTETISILVASGLAWFLISGQAFSALICGIKHKR